MWVRQATHFYLGCHQQIFSLLQHTWTESFYGCSGITGKSKNKQVIFFLFPPFFFFYCIPFLFFLSFSCSFFCVCMESVGFSLCLCFCCHSTGYSSLEVVFLVFSPPCPLKYFHFPPNTYPFSLLLPLLMKHLSSCFSWRTFCLLLVELPGIWRNWQRFQPVRSTVFNHMTLNVWF